jgi:hypothetical protein
MRGRSRAVTGQDAVEDCPHGDDSQRPAGASLGGEAAVIRNVVVGRLRQSGDPAQQAADAALLQEGLPRSGSRACSR